MEEGVQPNGQASIVSVGSVGSVSVGGESRPGAKRLKTRTCVGCGERVEVAARGSLVRLILGPEGEVAVDPGDGGFGRGAHVHPRPDCIAKAVQRGLAKAAKGRVHAVSSGTGELAPLRPDTLAEAIRAAMERRIEGLLAAAVRSRQVAFGSDAVTGACERGEAALVVVACDAAAAADLAEVRRAIAEGRAVSWGTKLSLAALFGGGEAARPSGVGVIALTSPKIAEAIREAVHIADGSAGRAASAGRSEPPQNSHRDSRNDSRKDNRADKNRKGSPGRAGKVSLGIAAGAAANRRVGRVGR